MYSKVEISYIVVRGVEVKKSEIRLKSENLHPCLLDLPVLIEEAHSLLYISLLIYTSKPTRIEGKVIDECLPAGIGSTLHFWCRVFEALFYKGQQLVDELSVV